VSPRCSLVAGAVAIALWLDAANGASRPSPSTDDASPGAAGDEPIFVEASAATGLVFTHRTGARGAQHLLEVLGAGVVLFDYDNDQDLDVYVVQSGPLPAGFSSCPRGVPCPEDAVATLDKVTSRLFRNDLTIVDGVRRLRFSDVTEQAGVALSTYAMGGAAADYDNDGDLDLLVTAFGQDMLYRNNGDGTFTDVSVAAGIADRRWSTSASFFDYDRDGDVDLFIANYLDLTPANSKVCYRSTGDRDYCKPTEYAPVPSRLLRNDGRGRFVDVTAGAGLTAAYGAGLGVAVGDYDGDGWLDMFVANDATPNQLWINQRDGRFLDEGFASGTALSASGRSEGSMGVAAGDFDADGDEDLLITTTVTEVFSLYENDGRARFDDTREARGLVRPTASLTGFGIEWIDYDNDGWLDVFSCNGPFNNAYMLKNLLLRNARGRRFEDVTRDGGPAVLEPSLGRGAAFGDLDNDGDTDIVFSNSGGPLRLLLNTRGTRHHALRVRLDQGRRNRWAVGAWVGVERAGQPTMWRRVRTDGSYLSGSDPRLLFGLGASPAVETILVQWPDGVWERWTPAVRGEAPPGVREIMLVRGSGVMESRTPRSAAARR